MAVRIGMRYHLCHENLHMHCQSLLSLLCIGSIITLEDVLEALLQEQIYDESDKLEREAERIARWATLKWKAVVIRRKRERLMQATGVEQYSMGSVVGQAMSADNNERTQLLGGRSSESNQSGGLFGFFENFMSSQNE
jgi:hypothetical protein